MLAGTASIFLALRAAILAGEVAPVLVTSNGLYLVRLAERRTPGMRPLAEVREAIRYELQQAKRFQREQEFFAEMKRGLDIRVNHAALKLLPTSNTAAQIAPPALPGS